MIAGKAHQRLIREKYSDSQDLFDYPDSDISLAELKEITYKQAETIILKYEWLGTMGTTQRHYGIFYNGCLAGVVCFGYFQAMQGYARFVGEKYAKQGTQLSRGACVSWAHPHSGSKLIAYGLRMEKEKGYKFCVAFSDPEAGEIGTLYQATNWHYIGFNKHKHYDIYYKDSGKIYMNDRDMFKKLGFSGLVKINEYISDRPELEVRLRKEKARYVKLIGSKQENKEMMRYLEPNILPYPKRGQDLSGCYLPLKQALDSH
jgi:hypothetical protein